MSEVASFELMMSPNESEASRLTLRGRVGVMSALKVHESALKLLKTNHSVVIDCSQAEYLDASIMQIILALGRELSCRGVSCDLYGVGGSASASFRLCGVVDS